MMTSSRDQLLLVFGLLYGCGALIELLIRVSQGLPRPVAPFFTRNVLCSAVLQPAFFFVLPALLWPLVIAHRIFGPLVAVIQECCCCGRRRKENDGFSDNDDDDDDATDSGERIHFSTGNRSGSTLDILEKGYAPRGDAPRV